MRRAKTTMCLAKWLTLYISVCCCFKINLVEISRQHDLYKVLTRSSLGEELLSITLFTNIQIQYSFCSKKIKISCIVASSANNLRLIFTYQLLLLVVRKLPRLKKPLQNAILVQFQNIMTPSILFPIAH